MRIGQARFCPGRVRALIMRNNITGLVLAGMLLVVASLTAFLTYRYFSLVKQMQILQAQSEMVNYNRTRFKSLVSDSAEYSRQNPALDPILQSIGVRKNPEQPSKKPAGK